MKEQAPGTLWVHDLLCCKMFQESPLGGTNHFYFVLVDVGKQEVVMIYDGLLEDGMLMKCSVWTLVGPPRAAWVCGAGCEG